MRKDLKMDYICVTTTIKIINRPLYEFICDYSYHRLLKDGIRISNIASLKTVQADCELSFKENWGDDSFECQPESIYDASICFLIFLGASMDWTPGRFRDFKEAYLKKIPIFEEHFEDVFWETREITRRPYDDGTIEHLRLFTYHTAENITRYSETRIKIESADMKEIHKYHDYTWKKLEERIRMNN